MELKQLFPPTIDGTVYLEITHKCNFNCKHCYVKAPQNREMSWDNFKRILNTLQEKKFKKIVLTGGEPLLHPNIKEMIELIKKKGFSLVLITNGSLVKKVKLRELV